MNTNFNVEINTFSDLAARVILLPSGKKITIPQNSKRERYIGSVQVDERDYKYLKNKMDREGNSSLRTLDNDASGN